MRIRYDHLRSLFVMVDQSVIFNPASWPLRELASRVAALTIIAAIIGLRIEERKLELVFADYAIYKDRTGMFMPKIGRIRGG